MSKPAGLALLILGLILGPGYFIYTRFYTGREITDLPLEFQQQGDGTSRAAAEFDLLPEMGVVTFIVSMTASHGPVLNPPNMPRNTYRARVTFNGDAVVTKDFTFKATQMEATPAWVFRQALPVMKIGTPGKYALDLVQKKDAGMQIIQASVQARAGVHHINQIALTTGIVLMVLGVVFLLLAP